MSWYNRKPRLKEPKKLISPKHISPATEKILKDTKKRVSAKEIVDKNPVHKHIQN